MQSPLFASDTCASVDPHVLASLATNNAARDSYGSDTISERVRKKLAELLGCTTKPFIAFVPTGTGANMLALATGLNRVECVYVAKTGHINADECQTTEAVLGNRVIPIGTGDGKLTPILLDRHVDRSGMLNRALPGIVSISQPTEYHTVYTLPELARLSDWCNAHGMRLHIDGARLGNALASLNIAPREMFKAVNAHSLSFGLTKNGGLFGEAVVVFGGAEDADELASFQRMQSQYAQLPAKTWAIAAGMEALLHGGRWLDLALHANEKAFALSSLLRQACGPEFLLTQPVQTNAVFWRPPQRIVRSVLEQYAMYPWHAAGEYRLVTSHDTADEHLASFAHLVRMLVTSTS